MLLAIYLNDHLGAATGALELARRTAAANRGTSWGAFLEQFEQEAREDRHALRQLMGALDVRPDPLKVLGGWTAEKLGRLKLNGRLLSYSPLSRLLELEVLELGVRGKLAMWLLLQRLARSDERLQEQELQRLIARAEQQLEGLEQHRLQAGETAFTAAA